MKKQTIKKSKLKKLLRPMFSSTIRFGYATEKQVDDLLDTAFLKGSK